MQLGLKGVFFCDLGMECHRIPMSAHADNIVNIAVSFQLAIFTPKCVQNPSQVPLRLGLAPFWAPFGTTLVPWGVSLEPLGPSLGKPFARYFL